MLSTLVLFVCIAVISILLTIRIDYLTKEQCYEFLTFSTEEACGNIENNFTSDRISLRVLSRIIAQHDDLTSGEVNKILTAYDVSSLISNVAILTADNTVVQIRGGNIENNTVMDFEEEKSLGEHISGLQTPLSSSSSNNTLMRSFVPIKKLGKIVGMLFLEMNSEAIANSWSPEIYDNSASFCIIDRATGDFLVNSWDENMKNVSDLGSDSLSEDLLGGKTGFVQMDVTGEFVSYMPMEIESWEIIVAVGEEDVFSSANEMRKSMAMFLTAGAILLFAYLLWIMYSNRRSIANTEKQANIDVLTGLQNRNRYEIYCKKLEGRNKGVACIYIDANGLHEINNTMGHLAGDQMLRFIADSLKSVFGEDTVYRIGGDEFVVFQKKKTQTELESLLEKVHSEVEKNDYHVSSGLCVCESDMSVNDMIKTAEKRMYEAKRRYYESIGRQVRNNVEE